ncbi:MAG: hypothetical protein H0X30_22730 [Anaerolineae bacterium]|nr:hypothetical protein [Anaerolineae bacterium]
MARKRYNFWLNDQIQSDWHINELITTLKAGGQFTRAIREGLRLWVDLRAGNTAVLIELFPQFKEKLTPTTAPATGGGGGSSELAKEIAAQIVLMGGTPGYLMQSAQPLRVEDLITPADIAYLERQKKAPMKAAAAPPKAEAQQASVMVTADDIADNFLAQFS